MDIQVVNEHELNVAVAKYNKDYMKVLKTIVTSTTHEHYIVCKKLAVNFYVKWGRGIFKAFAAHEYKVFMNNIYKRDKSHVIQ
jgi:hypothetical protein